MEDEPEQSTISKVALCCECPVCYDIMRTPLTMCVNGHCVCCQCASRITTCPTCRAKFSSVVPVILHGIIDILTGSCVYSQYGCRNTLDVDDKSEHQRFCVFRPTPCMYCSWVGSVCDLQYHIKSLHSKSEPNENSLGCIRLDCTKNKQEDITSFLIDNVFLWMYVKFDGNDQVRIAVQCIPTDRRDLSTILHFTATNETLRYTVFGLPLPDTVNNEHIFDCGKALKVPDHFLHGKKYHYFQYKFLPIPDEPEILIEKLDAI